MKMFRSFLKWLTGLATKQQIEQLEKIMALNQTQLEEKLKAMSLQSDKIAAEQSKRFDDLTEVINKLKEQIEAGNVSPEVEATLGELETKLQSLDDTIPDVATPEV